MNRYRAVPRVGLLLLLSVAGACSDSPEAPNAEEVYVLLSINGKETPAPVFLLADAGTSSVVGSTLSLRHNGTYRETIEYQLYRGAGRPCDCAPQMVVSEGNYVIAGDALTLRSSDGGSVYGSAISARVDGDRIVLTHPTLDAMIPGPDELVFVKQ